jgi:hypothetical protein
MNFNKKWEIYYRGSLGKWAERLKERDEKNVSDGLFKRYLQARKKLNSLVDEMNKLELDVESKYLLLNAIPSVVSESENDVFLKELIVYINSKEEK